MHENWWHVGKEPGLRGLGELGGCLHVVGGGKNGSQWCTGGGEGKHHSRQYAGRKLGLRERVLTVDVM